MSTFINESIVDKKMGHEYLAYRNESLAIWYLYITYQQATSMHCHCFKNTGLIVLDGIAKISFLNNSISLKGLDKIQIFRGRFHSTKSLSVGGIHVLEIEAPEDKTDLVRLHDLYGRDGQEYEDESHYIPKHSTCLDLSSSLMPVNHAGCLLAIQDIKDKSELIGRNPSEIVVILKGGVIEPKKNRLISGPGDTVSSHNFDILLEKFNIMDGTQILTVTKHSLVSI